jgi:hypothetical protein
MDRHTGGAMVGCSLHAVKSHLYGDHGMDLHAQSTVAVGKDQDMATSNYGPQNRRPRSQERPRVARESDPLRSSVYRSCSTLVTLTCPAPPYLQKWGTKLRELSEFAVLSMRVRTAVPHRPIRRR